MKTKNYLLAFGLIASSIISTYFVTVSAAQQTGARMQQSISADNEYQVAGILYMQKAAEYRALCYQAFNLAKMNLSADFDKKALKKLSKT